jgi:antitoxin VapB
MALNIKDPETVRLAAELAAMTGETKTRAVRLALEERRDRLRREDPSAQRARAERLRLLLEDEIWPQIPPDLLGRPITKAEREEILGIGPEGY